MICFTEKAIRNKARKMPIAYLSECEALRVKGSDGLWCYTPENLEAIRKKFGTYRVSTADPYRSRISGCCDRADQY
jgi:hypothetical protein